MARIWTFFIEKKALSYLLLATLVLFGLTSALTIQRESSPEVQIPIAIITSALPGASPEDIEALIVEEIEVAVAGIDDIKKLTSTSREGVGTVIAEFEASADIKESIDKVKDEVDTVRGDLPDDATDPVVSEVNFTDQPIIMASIMSDLPVTEFKQLADNLTNRIESLKGVSRAEVTGVRDREVTVVVRKEDLTLYGLTLADVVNAIRMNDVTAPVGSIEVSGVEYAVEFEGSLEDPSLVVDIPIQTPGGRVITVNDVAFVADGVEDYSTISRVSVEQDPAIQAATLMVYKQGGADITTVSEGVASLIAELDENGDTGAKIIITFDAGEQIVTDLTQLTRTGLTTVFLVLMVLFVALGWREALIASLSIPLSFLTALTVMNATGNTINFISLFSLILSIGILVDTAIVMTEAIHTNMKRHMNKVQAVRKAIKEFHYPITTGNLTTIAVFFPLFTISGVTGEFIASIPFTVIAVLVSSLIISLTFIPLIASTFLHRDNKNVMEDRQEQYADVFRNWYRKWIPWLLDSRTRKRWFVGLLTLLFVALLSFPFFGLIRVSFFPQSDVDFLYINLEEPQGTPLLRTDLSIQLVEDAVLDIEEIESFTTTIGAGSAFDQSPKSGARFASLTINLTEDRGRSSTEILHEIEERLAPYTQLDVQVLQPSEGPPSGAPVLVTFFGDNLVELKGYANDAADVLRSIEGTRVVSSSGENDANAFTLTIDRGKAAELGLSPAAVAGTLRTAVFGTEATSIKLDGEDVDVVVKLNLNRDWENVHDTNRVTLDAIAELPIATPRGTILLGSVLTSSLNAASDVISREDEQRITSASSQVAEGYVAREVSMEFEKRFKEEVDLPEGVQMKIGGETEDVDQSFQDMFRALGMGMVLVLAVLVIQFNSFRQALIVLTVVPLSLIGVLLGLFFTREYLSFPTMLGFIALAGIVVNNAIILMDVWNRLRREQPELPLREVVIEGAALRLRPIFLTTVTTIVGISPLIFASDLWRPIAVAIMFGLSFAVVLTLMLVPSLYLRFCKESVDEQEEQDTTSDDSDDLPPAIYIDEEKEELTKSDSHLFTHIMKSALVTLLMLAPLIPIHAFTYNQENIKVTYHEAPAIFSFDEQGQAFGKTVSGMAFRQLNVANELGARIQKFEIGTAYWYVSDQGIIWAASDLEALSIYLTLSPTR